MRFAEFNRIFNPYDERCYFSHTEYQLTNKKRYQSFADISAVIRLGTYPDLEIGFELTDNISLIETKDKLLIEFIKSNKVLNTYIIKNRDTYQILFNKDSDDKNLIEYTTNILSRATCKVKTDRAKHFIILPFKAPTNSSSLLNFVTEEYEHNVDHLDEIPFEFQPIVKKPYTNHTYKFPVRRNFIANLTSIVAVLKSLIKEYDDIIKSIEAINEIYFDVKLTEEEIKEVIEEENLIVKTFFKDNQPDYKVISDYTIEQLFVKYDEYSNELFYYNNVDKVYINDEKYIESYLYRLMPSLKTTHISEILESIRRITYLSRVKFNSAEFNVLFKNGLYNLVDDSFSKMNPDLYETNMIGANYQHEEPKPNKFVDDFFKTLTIHDKNVEQLIYEGIGYSMFRTSQFQKAFLLYGGGKNGKSTLMDLIKNVLHTDNVTKVSFKDLENTFRPAKLENKLASIAPDISSSNMEESDSMKSIISGDDVTLERKNKDSYDRPVYATMWFGANKLPRTPDNSYGFYRRFIVIPLKADLSHVSSGEGKRFYDELMKQENIDYVANKSLRAFANVYFKTSEFTMPTVVVNEIEYYKDVSDSVRQFMKNCAWFKQPTAQWPDLDRQYENYKDFCVERGQRPKQFNNYEMSWDLLLEEVQKEERKKIEEDLPF